MIKLLDLTTNFRKYKDQRTLNYTIEKPTAKTRIQEILQAYDLFSSAIKLQEQKKFHWEPINSEICEISNNHNYLEHAFHKL